MTNSLPTCPALKSLSIRQEFTGSSSPLPASYLHSPTPRKDSPSDARPCTPQPAPPTPRARRWGQQRPIICRQRLLNRVGCWLKNEEWRVVREARYSRVIFCGGIFPLMPQGPANNPAVEVRKQPTSDRPLPSCYMAALCSGAPQSCRQESQPRLHSPSPSGQILIRQLSSVCYN